MCWGWFACFRMWLITVIRTAIILLTSQLTNLKNPNHCTWRKFKSTLHLSVNPVDCCFCVNWDTVGTMKHKTYVRMMVYVQYKRSSVVIKKINYSKTIFSGSVCFMINRRWTAGYKPLKGKGLTESKNPDVRVIDKDSILLIKWKCFFSKSCAERNFSEAVTSIWTKHFMEGVEWKDFSLWLLLLELLKFFLILVGLVTCRCYLEQLWRFL